MKHIDHFDRGVVIGALIATFSIGISATTFDHLRVIAAIGLATSALLYLGLSRRAAEDDGECRK